MTIAGPSSAPTQQANPLDMDAFEQEDNAKRHTGQYTRKSTQNRPPGVTRRLGEPSSDNVMATSADELL